MRTVANDRPRRVAICRLPINGLLRLFVSGGRTTVEPEKDPLPDDVRVVNHRYDPLTDAWEILLESESFEIVPECQAPPYLPYPTIHVSYERLEATD